MMHTLFVAGLMAASASAQAKYASEGFQYVGCVQAKACAFPVKMDLGDSFTIAQCQQACGKNGSYAAASGNGCHCEDPVSRAAPEYDVTDDSRCSRACKPGDEKAGQCGGPNPAEGEHLYNVYHRIPTEPAVPKATLPRVPNEPAAATAAAAAAAAAATAATATAAAAAVAVGDATSAAVKTLATHPPETTGHPAKTGIEEPHSASAVREHSQSAAESRGEVACSNCTTAAAPHAPTTTAYRYGNGKPSAASLPSDLCHGYECPETNIAPALSSKAAPAATASNPSHSVIVSEGPSRPVSVITVALGMTALVLAMGMS